MKLNLCAGRTWSAWQYIQSDHRKEAGGFENPFCTKIEDFEIDTGLQIRVRIGKIFSLFLNQNICCGYSKEPSQ